MRFLVIGLGSIGLRHARHLRALGHEVLGYDLPDYGMWPADIERVKDLWDRDFLRDVDNINGCIIAAPTSKHASYIDYAVGQGWEHIFVEKPIADKVSTDLLTELEFAKDHHIKIFVGNNLRFHPSVRLARRYLKEGLIGRPIWAHIAVAQYNDRPQYRRDGVTLNWGAHEFDLALWLLGSARVASANIDSEDTIADVGLVHLESRCWTTVHLDYLTEPELRQSVIIGDKGRMVISITGRYIALQAGERGRPPEQQDGSFDEDYLNEMIAFVNAVEGKPWPGATAEDGIEALKIIDAARERAHGC